MQNYNLHNTYYFLMIKCKLLVVMSGLAALLCLAAAGMLNITVGPVFGWQSEDKWRGRVRLSTDVSG